MDTSNKDKASDKRPLGGGATPRGDRQPPQDDLAKVKDKREIEEFSTTTEGSADSPEQVKVSAKEEKAKAERVVFQRKPIIARTPPQGRVSASQKEDEAVRNLRGEEVEPQGEKTKRKRGEDSPTTSVMIQKKPKKLREVGADEDKKIKLMNSVLDLISRVDAGVANLYSTTSTSRNTKVEIKDEAKRLVVLMKKLMKKDFGNLLEDGGSEKPQTRDVGIQADLGGTPDAKKDEEMAEVTSLEDISRIAMPVLPQNPRWRL